MPPRPEVASVPGGLQVIPPGWSRPWSCLLRHAGYGGLQVTRAFGSANRNEPTPRAVTPVEFSATPVSFFSARK